MSEERAADGPVERGGLYFSHPACLEHDPRAHMLEHPDTPERLVAIERTLAAHDWLGWRRREAPPADEARLELIHSPRQIARIRELVLAGGGAIDADTFVGEPSYRAALHAAGGACEMVRALLAGEAGPQAEPEPELGGPGHGVGPGPGVGFCGVRPSGHHAEPDRAMGFCLFNNVAIAAEYAIRELGTRRVFILDWDVHHGNGTAEAFRRRSDVLFASIHQSGIYPGSGALSDAGSGPGEGYTINLPVPAGSEEELWLSLIEHIVLPAARAFDPQLVLISAGFDAHLADPLAVAAWRPTPSRRWPGTSVTSPRSSGCRSAPCSREATNRPRWRSACARRSRRSAGVSPRPRLRPRRC